MSQTDSFPPLALILYYGSRSQFLSKGLPKGTFIAAMIKGTRPSGMTPSVLLLHNLARILYAIESDTGLIPRNFGLIGS